MKNKNKTEKITLWINSKQTTVLILIITLFFINSIQITNIHKNLKTQTKILIQISEFFEIEKPSAQMVELEVIK